MTNRRIILGVLMLALACGLSARAGAQTPIDPAKRYNWQENCGWVNWIAGMGGTTQSVAIRGTYVAGWVWGENIGWIHLGDVPLNNVSHTNVDNTDFGVNKNPATGELSGYAWGENVGWINFGGGALALPPNAARFDAAALRFRGYAWGENIGWFNLDDATAYVGAICTADFNQSGVVSVQDIFDFLRAWFDGSPAADVDASGTIDVTDIFVYLTAWFNGC